MVVWLGLGLVGAWVCVWVCVWAWAWVWVWVLGWGLGSVGLQWRSCPVSPLCSVDMSDPDKGRAGATWFASSKWWLGLDQVRGDLYCLG